jgi:hypothetical protein
MSIKERVNTQILSVCIETSPYTLATYDHSVFHFSLTIIVTFPDNTSDKVFMKVDITSEGATGACNETTWWQNRTDNDWSLCSEKDRQKPCEDLCGVGTGKGIPITEGA